MCLVGIRCRAATACVWLEFGVEQPLRVLCLIGVVFLFVCALVLYVGDTREESGQSVRLKPKLLPSHQPPPPPSLSLYLCLVSCVWV